LIDSLKFCAYSFDQNFDDSDVFLHEVVELLKRENFISTKQQQEEEEEKTGIEKGTPLSITRLSMDFFDKYEEEGLVRGGTGSFVGCMEEVVEGISISNLVRDSLQGC